MFENEELCAACGGDCCNNMPGAMMPDDIKGYPGGMWGLMSEKLYSLFYTKHYVIDCWEGDPRPDKDELDQAYYIRPKNDDTSHPGLYSFSWGGRCIFLTEHGCKLEAESRPYTCRMLEPKPNKECIVHGQGGKRGCAIAWIEHTDAIERAARKIQAEWGESQ